MEQPKSIKWGINDDPTYDQSRSPEHVKFLIESWNKDKPEEEHVHSMLQLITAMKKEQE